jgi:bifunctional DNase/RNase
MTHDLIGNIIQGLQARVTRVVITDLKQNTFYAIISLAYDGKEAAIDSRPSDAIAVAIRQKAPILVSRGLADKMIDEVDEIFESLQPKDTIH